MEITFFGAARTVTGSQHLIDVNGYRILLDCGLYQGPRQESKDRNRHLPFDAASVDVLILSHAHIDHSGNIPNLVKSGFTGDIISTFATRDLCNIMLRDSAKIQEMDVEYLNKKRRRSDLPPLEPIYTMADALDSLKLFIGIGYERPYNVAPGITLTFYDAGHILGSALVALDIEDKAGATQRLVFSGDLGRVNRPILNDPTFLDKADILLLESTYGNREHPEDEDTDHMLEDIIRDTVKQGGKVIVPAFAVGRTQELVYRLNNMVERGDLPRDLAVYVDSPLAIDATSIFRAHPEVYDEETAEVLMTDRDHDPFGFRLMHYTRSVEESKALNFVKSPAVIISASGMAEAGRILHHLKNNVEDGRNTVLITGFQAPNTLGRRIVEGRKRIKIFGEDYDVRARVTSLTGMSGHADRSELVAWAGHFEPPPRRTFLVHGEPDAAFALAERLRTQLGFPQVDVPELGQRFTL
ncbi:MAG: MBL fold metallo-hydrolase [Anaerolineae bacterium]|nr:MBL fold metallo-hydrolase [Anaerolineales bacterium]MCB8934116.1 MBL fold metallo-hydrolase [Promineifilum sp.]MCW5845702.1 MBL fold metallo-hydrolase [Anaerolineae bacterium]